MEEEVKKQDITPPAKPQPIIVKRNNNAPLVGAIIFLALVIGAAVVFYAMRDNSTTAILPSQLSPTPTIVATPSKVPEISITELQLVTYNFEKMKDLSFPAFSITHPQNWTVKENRADLISTLTLTKGGSIITINQGPTGGSQCIFKGPIPDGPANDYRESKYVDIISNEITFRRIVPEDKQGTLTYSFCSNSTELKTSFGIPTIYGEITYTLNSYDENLIQEMDNIIRSIKSQ